MGVEVGDGVDDLVLMGVSEFGVDGEGQSLLAGLLGMGELAGAIAEISEGLLQVEAERVVDLRRNTGQAQRLFEFVATFGTDRELIVDVVVRGRRRGRRGDEVHEILLCEELTITTGAILTASFPTIQMTQFDAKDGGLEPIETAIGTEQFVEVFRLAAVHPEHAEAFIKCEIVGSDEAAIAGGTEILGGEKAEAAEVAESADESVVVFGADGLGGVLDHD